MIGIGNEYRRDDGVGPAVADQISRYAIAGVHTVCSDGEPTGLIETWNGAELAIVIDAVVLDPPTPGRVLRTTMETLSNVPSAGGSHALGVPDAVRLGRVLERLPARLVVFAVEAADLSFGVGLSPAVADTVPDIVADVLTEIGGSGLAEALTVMTATGLEARLESAVVDRRAAASLLRGQTDTIVQACEQIAQRFRSGGTLYAFGTGGGAADAAHIAVEFVHPVIVGKPALSAFSLASDTASLTAIARLDPHDIFAAQLRVIGPFDRHRARRERRRQ